jgi:hypothetical protein
MRFPTTIRTVKIFMAALIDIKFQSVNAGRNKKHGSEAGLTKEFD